jgi:hypothetical protein
MADGEVPGKPLQPLFIENIRNEAHRFFEMDIFPVRRAYAGTFLAAVLKGIKSEIGEVGGFRMPVDAKNTAFFIDIMKGRLCRATILISHWVDGSFQQGNW